KLLCIALSIATVLLSATLTAQFMYVIGSDLESPYLMASFGFLLDVAKCTAPLFVVFLWVNKLRFASIATAILSVSFSASMHCQEQSFTVPHT
ncbi:hypothetical protein J8A13_24345, partial [Vibrio parahaemolyticus]|nr:hypothetical protein [Vibrio parahaemolyticus]